MLRIREAIVVEGRYDQNTLSQLVDTLIIPTQGFGIFRDEDLLSLLRRIAARRGLIILTDSDSAGFLIRNHLKGALPPEQVKHAYLPDLPGKERRKRSPGAEGKLGAEGMSPEILEQALRRAGATVLGEDDPPAPSAFITRQDLYADGFSGHPDSAARRRALLCELNLPEHLSTKALAQVLSALLTREEYRVLAGRLRTSESQRENRDGNV